MSVVTDNNTDTGKVVPVAPKSMPELKTNDMPITSVDEEYEDTDDQQPGQADIWNLIQSQKPDTRDVPPPYVHPLVRRSSSSLSQKSLEICTESLGSETGSDDFLASFTDSDTDTESEHGNCSEIDESELLVGKDVPVMKIRPMYVTNQEFPYHCTSATVSRKSQARSFPPPLPSISSSNGGPCLRMKPYRCGNGRLVMEAVSMPTQNSLHARRLGGRLLLSFGDQHAVEDQQEPETESETECEESEITEEIEMEESEEEEEVEVVDRGTMVEVKVTTQPNQPAGRSATASKKVHRSSLVLNKFVGSSPDDAMTAAVDTVPKILPPSRRAVAMPTTAAAAMVAASALSASSRYEQDLHEEEEEDGQSLFVATTAGSKRRSKEELLHQMRRCSQLRRPLFIWEPRCIATL